MKVKFKQESEKQLTMYVSRNEQQWTGLSFRTDEELNSVYKQIGEYLANKQNDVGNQE